MKFLWLINIVIILTISGCIPKAYQSYQKVQIQDRQIPVGLFSAQVGKSYLFKSSIDYDAQHFSGLLLIKLMKASDYRAVFTTELGVKIFDLEFTADKVEVHYVLESINRNRFVGLVANDLKLLLMNDIDAEDMVIFESGNEGHSLYRFKQKFYLFQGDKVVRMDDHKNKITIKLSGYQGDLPGSVFITHGKTDLDLQLDFIKR